MTTLLASRPLYQSKNMIGLKGPVWTGSLIGMPESEMVLAFLLGKKVTGRGIGFVAPLLIRMGRCMQYGDNTVTPLGVSG